MYLIKTLTVTLFVFLFATSLFGETSGDANNDIWKQRTDSIKNISSRNIGAERYPDLSGDFDPELMNVGIIRSGSPGIQVGITSYDLQSNCRMTRQIDWRNSQNVHFAWMYKTSYAPGGIRYTAYDYWDADAGELYYNQGINVHSTAERSGYVGMDVSVTGHAVVGSHYSSTEYTSTVFYSLDPSLNLWSHSQIPWMIAEAVDYLWPSIEYQVFGSDTVVHVFGSENTDVQKVAYFRMLGGYGGTWDSPIVLVDTIPTISQTVVASRSSQKVALVWQASPGAYPGDPESIVRGDTDPGLGAYQRTNDVYYMISDDMGGSWNGKVNASKYDSTVGGWLGHGDLSALIGTDENLHIVWNARETTPSGISGGLGEEFVNFYGSCLLHWDEGSDAISIIKDANWDHLPYASDFCTGGAWNEMSISKPQLSECAGALYTMFVQYHDLDAGIVDDCAQMRWDLGEWAGTANGELYISASYDNGLNWLPATNLSNTYTPHCDTTGSGNPVECESENWPSMSRYGMPLTTGNFDGVPVMTGLFGGVASDHYLDVLYIDDKFPGSCFQDVGVWTTNPVKWFRIQCDDFITDSDGDGIADIYDNCIVIENPDQTNSDNDSYGDACDNCPNHDNEDQADSDSDGIGDVCDFVCGDANNDGAVNIIDLTFLIAYLYQSGNEPDFPDACDVNSDGSINIIDIVYLIAYLYESGPAPVCP